MDRLSPFETLMLVDRRPGFPMDFHLDVRVEGPLDRERLEEAVRLATAAVPRLRMRAARRRGRWEWLAPDREPVVEWRPLGRDDPSTSPWRPCDVTRSSGLRVVALELDAPGSAPAWSLILVVDHAVCDGLAAVEWLGAMWTAYHSGRCPAPRTRSAPVPRGTADASTGPSTAAPAVLADAGRLARDSGSFASLQPAVVAPLPPGEPLRQRSGTTPPYDVAAFAPDETRQLWTIASAAGVTVNDILVAAAMRTVIDWNAASGRPARHVRINMPVSLRAPGEAVTAGNHIGYAFLDRSADACRRPDELVRSLSAASRWIKDTGAAAQFLHALEALERVPGLLWLLTRLPLCLSTAVVSNVGNVGPRLRADVPIVDGCLAPGDLRVTAIVGVPPLRPRTRVAVGAMTYAGSLRMAVQTDERRLGAGATAAFAARLREAVTATAGAIASSVTTAHGTAEAAAGHGPGRS